MTAIWVRVGDAVHDAERQGLAYLADILPKGYVVFSNVALSTGRRGQFFEHDAIVVAPHGVFTVELKSWSGTIRGNRDRWTLADGATVASPLPLVGHKSRVLKGLLERKSIELASVWVQGLVFLSAPDAAAQLTEGWADLVHTRRTIAEAITNPAAWSSRGALPPKLFNLIESVLVDGRAPPPPTHMGDYRLIQRLDTDEAPYDAWIAEADLTHARKVLHVHAVDADDEAGRNRLRERAFREATLHERLRGGADVLRYDHYFKVDEDPRAIVLVFEDTTPWIAAATWVRERAPGMVARLRAGARIARALQWVHDREIVHRRLSADAILVSPLDDAETLRLCAFDLAHDSNGRAPTLTSPSGGSLRFSAPEVVLTGEATVWSDRFALGATLVELFLGRPPFPTVETLLRPVRLPPLVVGDRPVPPEVQRIVLALLSADPQARPTPAEVAERLERELRRERRPGPPELATDVVIRDTFRLEQPLGRGATATSWRAVHQQTGEPRVLKIADGTHAASLRTEARVLNEVTHDHLVRFYDLQPDGDARLILVLEHIDGKPLSACVGGSGGPPNDPEGLRRIGLGLLGALAALHDRGWLHRDIKPDNIVLRADGRPVVLDLGLACRADGDSNLAVGTPRYKDPLVYVEERWTPANDVYAAFLVLWELLTGLHPFAGTTPDLERAPILLAEDLPDAFSPAAAGAVSVLFCKALSPLRENRPRDAHEAARLLDEALRPEAHPLPAVPTLDLVPAEVSLDAPLTALPLSGRAVGALVRLHVRKVGELAGVQPELLATLPNVGRKTLDEIARTAAAIRRRWPDAAAGPALPTRPLAPALRADPRPLSTLGTALSPTALRELEGLGVHTVGDLAGLSATALAERPTFSPKRMDVLRRVLARLSGEEGAPPTLDALDLTIRRDLGDAAYAALDALLGLTGGTPKAGGRAPDLARLRVPASAATPLVEAALSLLPPVGFADLDGVAAAFAARLPTEGQVSPLGYARLAALLLRPDARATEAANLNIVAVAPWTEAAVDRLGATLGEATRAWPPVPRGAVEARLWDALDGELAQLLVRRGADPAQLLDAILPHVEHVRATPTGGLYTPPVLLVDALRVLRPLLQPRASAEALAEEVFRQLDGVEWPVDLAATLRDAGWRREGAEWCDPDRVPATAAPVVPVNDADIPRERVPWTARDDAAGSEVPPVVSVLRASVGRGGMRVVAMLPERQHLLSRRLHAWLSDALGPENVAWIDVDRVILDALQASSLWKYVAHQERSGGTDWRWLHREAQAGLDAAMQVARPGRLTLLARPALLGTLGLMPWLSGWYERSRYGNHGLLVLAVPGGVHEQRVQLNGRYPFPYTPDMAAVVLEESV